MVTKKCSPTSVPTWILKLPAGTYIIRQICEITGAEPTNVFMRLQALSVPYVKHVNDERVNVYEWPGAEYYLNKKHEAQLHEIKQQQKS
jgi:hypothetical protein